MARVPAPAQYLLRIDDLCTTVHQRRWTRLRDIVREFGIRPILAVVPDNYDPELNKSDPDPEFWQQMHESQVSGAAIAMHGYRHRCTSEGTSLIPLHRHTEFAGLDVEEQRAMLQAGLEILRGKGLNPRLWVAPRHGFDRNTLTALRYVGIMHLSDGFARRPFLRGGVVWIPQQIWEPAEKSSGLWTICLHPNGTSRLKADELRAFLEKRAGQFTSFDRVIAEFEATELGPGERLHEAVAMGRLRLRRSLKRMFRIR
jgi:predicted deacetylase